MSAKWLGIAGGCALLWAASLSPAAPPGAAKRPATAQDLAARIDYQLAARWAAAHVEPAPPADDAEFLRRVYLDLVGRIPSVAEARTFLADARPDRRARLVEELLASPGYVNHFANVWKQLLLPEADTNFEVRYFLPAFDAWLRNQFAENVGYDRMVRDLLTTPAGNPQAMFQYGRSNRGEASPQAYFFAKEYKPENLGASTAQLFLGIKLECAQCHDHPFAHWTRQQFWEYSAFYAGLERQGQGLFAPVREVSDRRELAIPGTGQVVQASYLDGSEPEWKYKINSRTTLADWMTRADNPYFARAAVNRLWAQFFGAGLVEPVDDLGGENSPSHPEMFNELAREFAAHQFDFKFLIRAITASRAYQLSSTLTHPSQNQPQLFAHMPVRGLSGEQLFDSIAQATGYRHPPRQQNPFVIEAGTPRSEFLAKFANQDNRTEFQTSILQALALMNGRFVADATGVQNSRSLAAVLDAPFLDTTGRIETLYLATLSRKPRPDELARLVKYVDAGGARQDPKAALGDVFWALLNSSEFILNH
jgi:hypothetical protein